MKKLIVPILLAVFLLCGCSHWMDGEYHSVKLHDADSSNQSSDKVTVSGYVELRDALVDMATSGRQQSTFYITDIDLDLIDQHMNTAIMHMFQNSAIGSYAVDKIDYESAASGGITAISVEISYIHGRQEILRIKNATNMDGVQNLIKAALRNCDTSTVVKVMNYEDMDIELLVQEYVNSNPHLCMELPQVTATTYPKQGDERVLEISYTYQTSRDVLRNMQEIVSPIFSAAELYVQSSDTQFQKYEQLYAFLMERFDYRIDTSITPVYSLLRYGVGDSKAFAMVYNIMCQNAELDCRVVPGTKNGEAYYWNLITIDGKDYHVDLLACSEAGEFSPKEEGELNGYVWDYSVFE